MNTTFNNEINNNESINFVETYLIEEVKELIHDNEKLDEYKSLTKSIGITDNLSVDTKSPIPFPPLTTLETEVFNTLCPIKDDIKDFNKTPIPIELLRLISLSINEKYFQKIEVWHDYKTPDPIVIGYTGFWYGYSNGNIIENEDGLRISFSSKKEIIEKYGEDSSCYFNDKQAYIIGRWADVKSTFRELQARAKERWVTEQSVRYQRDKNEAENRLKDINTEAKSLFRI